MKGWVVAILVTLVTGIFALLVFVIWSGRTTERIIINEKDIEIKFVATEKAYKTRTELIPKVYWTLEKNTRFKRYNEKNLKRLRSAFEEATALNVTKSTIQKPASFLEYQAKHNELGAIASYMLKKGLRYEDLRENETFLALKKDYDKADENAKEKADALNEAIQRYNKIVNRFPTSVIAVFRGKFPKAMFTINEEIE